MTFGEKLKEVRASHNFTQDQIAEKLIVSRQTVSKWELGVNEPDIDTLNKLAEMFDMSVDELIGSPKHAKSQTKTQRTQQLFLYNIVFNVFCVLAIFVLLRFLQNPMPAHWNIHGEIDRYGSKFEVLLHLLTYAVMTVTIICAYRVTRRSSEKAAFVGMIVCLCIDVAFILFALILYGKYLQENCLIRFVNSLAGCLIFTVSISIHPKFTKQNCLLGVRTKLTLSNEQAWNKVNKMACFSIGFTAMLYVALNLIFSQKLVSYLSILVYVPSIVAVAIFHHCVSKSVEKDA